MIEAVFYRNQSGVIYGFEIKNHGQDIVCAAVSMLALNTVNAIEAFTENDFSCEALEEGGYLFFESDCLKENGDDRDAALLLKTLHLGLAGVREEYENSICIVDKEVQ